jgi:cell wall-associated NlpC family hydrolase
VNPVAEVVESARSLLGTQYRYRGSDPSGFDCSGLTHYVFAGVGVELPRRAAEQAQAGSWVPLDELDAGDLVFFGATRLNPHHVGVVSSGPGEPLRMIHASSSRGVVETEILSSSYWLGRLEQGRRVLPRE